MSTIKRMAFDPANAYIPSDEELEEMKNYKNTDFSDCPRLSSKQLKLTRKAMDVHPEWYTPIKKQVSIRLDIDTLEEYKKTGKGYQKKINDALRIFRLEHPEQFETAD